MNVAFIQAQVSKECGPLQVILWFIKANTRSKDTSPLSALLAWKEASSTMKLNMVLHLMLKMLLDFYKG